LPVSRERHIGCRFRGGIGDGCRESCEGLRRLEEGVCHAAVAGVGRKENRVSARGPGPSCIFQLRSSNAISLGWRVQAGPTEGYQDISNTWLVHAFPSSSPTSPATQSVSHSLSARLTAIPRARIPTGRFSGDGKIRSGPLLGVFGVARLANVGWEGRAG
jgi:hypothetical protein